MTEKDSIILRTFFTRILPPLIYQLKIDYESKNRVKEIKEIVDNNRQNLNLIFYFNHTTKVDPLFVGNIATRINPKGLIIAPISYSNTENKPENKKTIIMTNIIKACGVETFRVVQTYQINNPDYNYDPKIVSKQNMAFMRGVSKLAKEEREFPISMIISPEGKRTEGSLTKAENGIIMCGSLLSPALYIPVGIDFEGEGINKELNLFKRVNLRIGETYLQQPGTPDKNLLTQLMTNLALTLPESRRGEYSQ